MADFIEHIRKLRVLMQNMVTRVVVDRSEDVGDYQVLWGGGRVSSGLEHLEPQGLHFRAAKDAGGVVVAAGGQREAGVLLVAGGVVPKDPIGAGEGGLHYLGEWKVFLRTDGQVCLGMKTPNDWVALASKVDKEISALKDDIQGIVTAIQGGIPTPQDGGTALQQTIVAGLTGIPHTPATVQSQKVRCE